MSATEVTRVSVKTRYVFKFLKRFSIKLLGGDLEISVVGGRFRYIAFLFHVNLGDPTDVTIVQSLMGKIVTNCDSLGCIKIETINTDNYPCARLWREP